MYVTRLSPERVNHYWRWFTIICVMQRLVHLRWCYSLIFVASTAELLYPSVFLLVSQSVLRVKVCILVTDCYE